MRELGLLGVLGIALSVGGAQAARAQARAVPGEVRLANAADLTALCHEIGRGRGRAVSADERREALATVYAMRLASDGFGLEPFDIGRQRVLISSRRGFRVPGGTGELMPYRLEGAPPDKVGFELAVPATSGEAASLARARRAGALTLTLWFRVATPPDEPPCATLHTRDGRGVRLAIEPLAFALARRGKTVARGETPAFAELRVAREPAGPPRVSVAPPVLTASRGPAPEPVARAAAALEPELLACYREALAEEPALRGSLVLGVAVNADGKVVDARPEIDGLGSRPLRECVLGRVRAARFPRVGRFSVPIRFAAE